MVQHRGRQYLNHSTDRNKGTLSLSVKHLKFADYPICLWKHHIRLFHKELDTNTMTQIMLVMATLHYPRSCSYICQTLITLHTASGNLLPIWYMVLQYIPRNMHTVFALLCFVVVILILTDFPISIRLTSLALWQSNDCPSASKATLMNMDKYFMWIHYERLHNHNKAKHNKTVCTFLGIYCIWRS